ncbi:amidohydrolase family protein [Duganella qianjiadongensis]|uniref:Amidohydrolase family protein n=1 Tax=Duganella qianjiadongensis TaxID=2692176 RepID=A0ABW9VFZ3_9BURK|nr:amidohydrolase family protein [Duganella qianjiadongensis]MYM37951.1 amidohydrolase family protein [Duganella qianjiadongensis]
MTDRRSFLRGAGALAMMAAAPAAVRASSASLPAARVLVDWHAHFVTNAEISFLRQRQTAPRVFDTGDGISVMENLDTASFAGGKPSPFSASDIAARLRHMDQLGISRQLLTHTVALGFDATLPLEQLRPLFRAVNDELAGIVRRYPGRFLAVAALPAADPQWAALELRRAHQELGLIGGSLPLNAFATLDSARTLAPLFATAQSLGSHFFIHRAPASALLPGQPPMIIPSDTEYARWSIISNSHLAQGAVTLGLTDFLDPYPDVSVEVIMLGGFLPYLIDTLVPAAHKAGVNDPLARLRRLYLDPGPYSRNGAWVKLAIEKLGADRILFGTDYGVGGGDRGDSAPGLATLDQVLTPAQRQQIYIDNSRQLLARKGITV